MRILLAILVACCSACISAPTAGCGFTAEDEGQAAFRNQEAVRSATDLNLRFFVNRTVDERFTSTPDVQTNLGEVLDARVLGDTLEVSVLLNSTLPANGEIKLTGSLSGTFGEDLDRCPYTRRFAVNQADTLGPVTVQGL